MSYGEKRRHQYFIVKYSINYPSGKKWNTQRECLSYSEIGARQTTEWIHASSNITIHSITPTGRYAGQPVYPSGHVIGEW